MGYPDLKDDKQKKFGYIFWFGFWWFLLWNSGCSQGKRNKRINEILTLADLVDDQTTEIPRVVAELRRDANVGDVVLFHKLRDEVRLPARVRPMDEDTRRYVPTTLNKIKNSIIFKHELSWLNGSDRLRKRNSSDMRNELSTHLLANDRRQLVNGRSTWPNQSTHADVSYGGRRRVHTKWKRTRLAAFSGGRTYSSCWPKNVSSALNWQKNSSRLISLNRRASPTQPLDYCQRKKGAKVPAKLKEHSD